MSREIKFRAWNTLSAEMRTFEDICGLAIAEFQTETELKWMQFTGLQDKNGVDIYEGDIVDSNFDKLVIVWDEDRCCFNMRGRYEKSHIIRQLDCDIVLDLKVKVVGNIYENGDLINE